MSKRRDKDFYPTPEWATEELLRHVFITQRRCPIVLECCAGDHAISDVLKRHDVDLFENDIDPARAANYHEDATRLEFWRAFSSVHSAPDYVVSNPPFSVAPQIVKLAYEYADKGVALLLRLSFLEPCENRGAWLAEYPPSMIIVLPRISFTGDGKCDNVTTAWFVWMKHSYAGQKIIIVPKSTNTPHAPQMERTPAAVAS